MHFKTLVAVDIPAVTEDEAINQEIQKEIAELETQMEQEPQNVLHTVFLEKLRSRSNAFSREVDRCVMDILAPYSASTDDPEYLEFLDYTGDLKQDFQHCVDCLRLADGRIVELGNYPYYYKYSIRDGKVYQREAGPLHHERRTKKAKRITALLDYPRTKLYQSFADYAENYRGFDFDEEHQAYGYYCNPNAMWDWYQVGGRWPAEFLVKETCTEYSDGERSWCIGERLFEAPEGFRWVTAARKKDIDWVAMRDWQKKKTMERFYRLEKMYLFGKLEEGCRGQITENGIIGWNGPLYRRGETVTDYLERVGIPQGWKYPYHVGDIVDADNWFDKNSFSNSSENGVPARTAWQSFLDSYIDNLNDDTVLVSVDYHM